MKNDKKRFFITGFLIISIALISFLTYRDMLGYFFTGTDAIPAIDSSRIHSFRDIITIFNEPHLYKTPVPELVQKAYRPITGLSYSLDYAIWKLNAFGYQLTNLMHHIIVSVLVFFLIRTLTNGKQVIAWLSAVIFTIHPIHVESFPTTMRRLDSLAALFMLLSLLLFLRYFSAASRKKGFMLLSILFFALALGTKEIAVIFPFFIFTYLIVIPPLAEISYKDRVVQSTKICLPYFVLTFMYIAWRTHVVQGIGGYGGHFSTPHTFYRFTHIIKDYFTNLLYPTDFVISQSLFSPFTTPFKQMLSLGILLVLFVIFLFYARKIFVKISHNEKGMIKFLKILLAAVVVLSIIGILVYFVINPYINQQVRLAYSDNGLRFLTNAMEERHILPLEYYFFRARDYIVRSLFILLFYAVIFLIGIHKRDNIKKFFVNSHMGKVMTLLIMWLLLPLGLYLMTFTFSDYIMYIPVIFFSAIISIMLVEGFQSVRKTIRDKKSFMNSTVLSFIIVVCIALSLIAISPIVMTFKAYGELEDSGKIMRMIFDKIDKILPQLPDNSVIHIYNLPSGISSYENRILRIRTVGYPYYYTIKSWINLNYPKNNMKIVVHSKSMLKAYPNNLSLEVKRERDNNVVVVLNFDYGDRV